MSVGRGRRGGSEGNATTVGWASGREEYSETTVRGQAGGRARGGPKEIQEKDGLLLDPLRKEVIVR